MAEPTQTETDRAGESPPTTETGRRSRVRWKIFTMLLALVAPGVRSIRRDGSLDQRALNTVVWLQQHRKPLVLPHFREAPQPPEALKDVYNVRAQTLGPIIRAGEMAGWISIHSLREREWSPPDLAALARATQRVHDALDGM